MVYIRSRKFCCCIPVRAGVFILSLAGVVFGSIISVVGWKQVAQQKQHPLPQADLIALYIQSGIFTALAILSIFGFIGTLTKQRNFVSAYGAGLTIQFILSLVSGIFTLYSLFHQNSKQAVFDCLNGSTDEVTKGVCQNGMAVYKAIAVVVYVVMWLLLIYAYIIVSNYVDQLDEEMSVKETRHMIQVVAQAQAQAAAAPTTYASFAAPAHNSGYAFSHTNQSYGARGNNSNNV